MYAAEAKRRYIEFNTLKFGHIFKEIENVANKGESFLMFKNEPGLLDFLMTLNYDTCTYANGMLEIRWT